MVGTTLTKGPKKTAGRQRIEIKKIEDVKKRRVTFSKRRTGLFKLASEIHTLTGCDVEIRVQSGKRIYQFTTNPSRSYLPLPQRKNWIIKSTEAELDYLDKQYSEMLDLYSKIDKNALQMHTDTVTGTEGELEDLELCKTLEETLEPMDEILGELESSPVLEQYPKFEPYPTLELDHSKIDEIWSSIYN